MSQVTTPKVVTDAIEALTGGGPIAVTGRIDAANGVTAGADQHVTVSGSGRFKHGNVQLIIPSAAALPNSGPAFDFGASGTGGRWLLNGSASIVLAFPITLPVGARMKELSVYAKFDTTASKTLGLRDSTGGSLTSQTLSSSVDFGPNVGYTLTLTLSPNVTITSGHMYYGTISGGASGDEVYHLSVTYDFP